MEYEGLACKEKGIGFRMEESAPYCYQTNYRSIIHSKFNIKNSKLTFKLADYDHSKDLIIDPKLSWATYFGGNGNNGDQANAISHDGSNNIYITGNVSSTTGIASSGAYQTSYGGGYGDAFVAKFSSSGVLAWATYYGGSNSDQGQALLVDANSNIYITGYTSSGSGIATSGAYQSTGDTINGAPFLAKFTTSGSLSWATYIGSNGSGQGLAIDSKNYIYITGYINDSGLASVGSYQSSNAGYSDAFLAKFSSSGSLAWATYFGGSANDFGYGIASDANSNIYITGYCASATGIATSGAYQTSMAGIDDVFLAKFNSDGNLKWATYYGGTNFDQGIALTTDADSNIYITGSTSSASGIASSGAYQTSIGGSTDVFLAKFTASGILSWGTYYGGSQYDGAQGICTDANNYIYITGHTQSSTGIATSGAYQMNLAGYADAFAATFTSSGSLFWGTYFGDGGGNNGDGGSGIIVDVNSNIYIAGNTTSTSYIATSGAYQTSLGGSNGNAFIAEFASTTTSSISGIINDVTLDYTNGDLKNNGLNGAKVSLFLNSNLIKTTTSNATGYFKFDSLVSGTYKVIASITTATGESIVAVDDSLPMSAYIFVQLPYTMRSQFHNLIDVLKTQNFSDGYLYQVTGGPVSAVAYDETYINILLNGWDADYTDKRISAMASLFLSQYALKSFSNNAATVIGKTAITAYDIGSTIAWLINLEFELEQNTSQSQSSKDLVNLANAAVNYYLDDLHWDVEQNCNIIPDDSLRSELKSRLDGAFSLFKVFSTAGSGVAVPLSILDPLMKKAISNFATGGLYTDVYVPYTNAVFAEYYLASVIGSLGSFPQQHDSVDRAVKYEQKATNNDSVVVDTLNAVSKSMGDLGNYSLVSSEMQDPTLAGDKVANCMNLISHMERNIASYSAAKAFELSGVELYTLKQFLRYTNTKSFAKKDLGQPYPISYTNSISGTLSSGIVSFDSLINLINSGLSNGPAHIKNLFPLLTSSGVALSQNIHSAVAPVYGAAPIASKYVPAFDSLFSAQLIKAYASQSASLQSYYFNLAAYLLDSGTANQNLISVAASKLLAANDTLKNTITRFLTMIKFVPVKAFIMVNNVSQPNTITPGSIFNLSVNFTNYGSQAATGLYAKIITTAGFTTVSDSVYIGDLAQGAVGNISFSIKAPANDTFGNYYIMFSSPNTTSDGIGGAMLTGTLGSGIQKYCNVGNASLSVYPNPFTSSTTVSYTLTQNQHTELTVRDISGKQIAVLANENQNAGPHIYAIDAAHYHLPTGLYFVKLVTGNNEGAEKIIKIE